MIEHSTCQAAVRICAKGFRYYDPCQSFVILLEKQSDAVQNSSAQLEEMIIIGLRVAVGHKVTENLSQLQGEIDYPV